MSVRSLSAACFVALIALGTPAPASPQGSPVSLEGRAGLALPSGALSSGQRDLALNTGLTVGVTALVHLGSELALYGSWSREGFGCAPNFDCDVEGGFTSHGYDIGVEYVLPHQTVWEPWVRGGVTVHKFRYRTGGGFETETDAATGFALGGGVNIPMGPRFFVTPSMRFARYVANLNLNTFATGGAPFTVTRVLAEVGGRFRF